MLKIRKELKPGLTSTKYIISFHILLDLVLKGVKNLPWIIAGSAHTQAKRLT